MTALERLQQSQYYRWIILVVTTISQTSVSICSQGLASLGPFFKDSFLLTSFTVGIIVSLMEWGMIPALIFAGRMVDQYGERRVLVIGGVLVGVFIVAASFAVGVIVLGVLIFLAGVFSASAVPAGSKAIMTWFPFSQRGLAMGLRQTGIPLGGVLGSLILPPLAQAYGWQISLLAGGIICILGALICWVAYRDFKTETIQQSAPKKSETAFASTDNHQSSIAASSSLGVNRQSSNPQPLKQVFANRSLLMVSVYAAFMVIGQYSLTIYIVFYLSEELKIPLLVASGFLAVAHGSGAVGRIIWGLVSDRMLGGSRRQTLYYIGGIAAVASAVVAILAIGTPYWLIYLVIGAFGFTMIAWTGMWVAYVSEIAEPNQAGTALGFGMTILQFGKVLGPPLFGLLHDLTGSFRIGWWLLAGLLVATTFMLRVVGEPVRDIVGLRTED